MSGFTLPTRMALRFESVDALNYKHRVAFELTKLRDKSYANYSLFLPHLPPPPDVFGELEGALAHYRNYTHTRHE